VDSDKLDGYHAGLFLTLLGYGSSRYFWVTLMPIHDYYYHLRTDGAGRSYSYDKTGDVWMPFYLPIPTVLGSYKLRCNQLKLGVYQADSSNYVKGIYLRASDDDGDYTTLFSVTGTPLHSSKGSYTHSFGEKVLGNYPTIFVVVNVYYSSVRAVKIANVRLKVWYA